MLRLVTNWFSTASDYSPYCFVERPSFYEHQVAKRVPKVGSALQGHVKTQIFDTMDPIPTTKLLNESRTACYNKSIHERGSDWLLPYLLEKSTPAELDGYLSLKPELWHKSIKDGVLTLVSYGNIFERISQHIISQQRQTPTYYSLFKAVEYVATRICLWTLAPDV